MSIESVIFNSIPPVINPEHLEKQTCTICLNDFNLTDPVVCHQGTLIHLFHEECLSEWTKISPSCPLDNKQITHIHKKQINNEKPKFSILKIASAFSVGVFTAAITYRLIVNREGCPLLRFVRSSFYYNGVVSLWAGYYNGAVSLWAGYCGFEAVCQVWDEIFRG